MSLTYGLPGIRVAAGDPSTWPSRPVVLPAGWKAIQMERAWIRGRSARIVARHGADKASIQMEERSRSPRAA
jgi:hypothetical protein